MDKKEAKILFLKIQNPEQSIYSIITKVISIGILKIHVHLTFELRRIHRSEMTFFQYFLLFAKGVLLPNE